MEHAPFLELFSSKAHAMVSFARQILADENGTTAVEYAVLLALIVVTVMGAIGAVGTQTGGMWGGIDTDLDAVGFGGGSSST